MHSYLSLCNNIFVQFGKKEKLVELKLFWDLRAAAMGGVAAKTSASGTLRRLQANLGKMRVGSNVGGSGGSGVTITLPPLTDTQISRAAVWGIKPAAAGTPGNVKPGWDMIATSTRWVVQADGSILDRTTEGWRPVDEIQGGQVQVAETPGVVGDHGGQVAGVPEGPGDQGAQGSDGPGLGGDQAQVNDDGLEDLEGLLEDLEENNDD